MKTIIRYVLCIAFVFAFGMPAYAQEEYVGPETGDVAFAPTISFGIMMPDEGSDIENLAVLTSFGYYFNRNVELGGTIMGIGVGESFTDYWLIAFTPFVAYHFYLEQSPRYAPYVGVGAGMLHMESSEDNWDDNEALAGVFAGLDYYVTSSTAVRFQVRYDENLGGDYDAGQLQFTIGLNIIF
jgi:hypothetical protein